MMWGMRMEFSSLAVCAAAWIATLSCASPPTMSESPDARNDIHSYSRPNEVRVRHVALDLDVDFDAKRLFGTAELTVERLDPAADEVVLDNKGLRIESAEASTDGAVFEAAEFSIGETEEGLGGTLAIKLPAGATRVRVRYATGPLATGLQWLEPAQTAGKKHPFLFTQSQAIHARTWIPLQDSPGVRVTYEATIRTPKDLLAVMSAEMEQDPPRDGEYRFRMPQPIPPYLIALAVGDLSFREMGPRSGVYAEPSVVDAAASEFEDTEAMMEAVEELYGPYRWGRYDLLVLPPSFPFGGMENPRLTFATPTILAGDKSLVNLVAHELAHSWSGNLVTNATWRDFWLNEGFTVYLETRIQEAVYGRERADMESLLEVNGLEEEMRDLEPRDQILHVDLIGRDPDDGFTGVPYVKGMLFLVAIEAAVGREAFDDFLRSYFDDFAFQSILTEDFVARLNEKLPGAGEKVDLQAWIEEPGLEQPFPRPVSSAFEQVESESVRWQAGEIAPNALPTASWTTQEWLHFLRTLPDDLPLERMTELDAAFELTQARNSEIAHQWLLESVRRGYRAADARVERFLIEVGRRKFLKPLYEALAETPEGKQRALSIYEKARPGYHPISSGTIDQILEWNAD